MTIRRISSLGKNDNPVVTTRSSCVRLVVVMLLLLEKVASAFHPNPTSYCSVLLQQQYSKTLYSASSSSPGFDFSSKHGWEDFYQQKEIEKVVEWHSSIPLSTIANLIPRECQHCVMLGCGTSLLPTLVLEQQQQQQARTKLTLVDSSPTCIQQLQQRYSNYSNCHYLCADATTQLFPPSSVNVILDKGLMDALLCGEGWDVPVQALVSEAARILRPNVGRYILVSYKLPASTKDFLRAAAAACRTSMSSSLEWEFDVEGSTDRVGISVARKITNNVT